jgi:hypothetical protein
VSRFVAKFQPSHYEWLIAARKSAERWPVRLSSGLLEVIARANSWTAVVDGDPVAVAGTMQQWPGRHTSWAYLGDDIGPHMHWITRETRKHLADVKGRIELTVREDFKAGHQWARMLDFKVESPCLEKYGPQGENHVGYVRFN